MNKKNQKVPFHIKGSKVRVKKFRGTNFIFEEVNRPCDLKDSDFVDKESL